MESRGVAEIAVLSVILVIVIFIGIIGNLLIILAIAKFARLRQTLSNLLLLNLSISDLIQSSVVMPYHLLTMLDVSMISSSGPLCVVGGIITYPFTVVSTLTLVMLGADRYIALSDPLRYRARVTLKTVHCMILYTWIHAVSFTIAPIFLAEMGFDELSLDCGIIWEESPLWFSAISMLLNIVCPFVFLTFMSFKVLLIARSQQRRIKAETMIYSYGRKLAKGRERRATSAILLVIFLFLLSWFPFLLTRVLRVFGVNLSEIYYTLSVWILHCNAVSNIAIYCLRRKELRRAFLAIIRRTRISNAQLSMPTESRKSLARNNEEKMVRQNTVVSLAYKECKDQTESKKILARNNEETIARQDTSMPLANKGERMK
ncbi:octopamine receptor 1 [Nematostella vectensis]|uniref:octopamine receptor 1 n=1 Tax=Nematostella vectensis TaxID=45351 RepID=UPI0013902B8F|nr:octopamine receptor 1 [Nematostella vectensis]XP_048577167.1 octopamine receptor 1 [Nematostella vectensis]